MARILIVEDEVHIQRLSRLIVEKAGHQAESVSSGEEALQMVVQPQKSFDLIILDIMMNGMDGLSTLKALRQVIGDTVPVILLTAISQEAVVVKGVQLGAKDFIRKPFHPNDLIDRIAKILKQ